MIGTVRKIWKEFCDWGLNYVGSSRTSGLVRIGLGLIIWARFASEQLPFRYELGLRTGYSLLFYLFTTLMIVGYKSRLTTLVSGLLTMGFYYLYGFLFDYEPYTHHHTYWLGIATLLCALTPCDKSYSLDRWFSVSRSLREGLPLPPERGNLWGLRLIVVQLTMMYFWSAYNKMHAGFLSGDRLEALFMYYYIGSSLSDWASWSYMFPLAAWLVVMLEIVLAFFLPFQRTRKYLVLPGIALHLIFYIMLPVSTYSITIILLYLAYFDADRVHRTLDKIQGYIQPLNPPGKETDRE
jgi:hypothetical protein